MARACSEAKGVAGMEAAQGPWCGVVAEELLDGRMWVVPGGTREEEEWIVAMGEEASCGDRRWSRERHIEHMAAWPLAMGANRSPVVHKERIEVGVGVGEPKGTEAVASVLVSERESGLILPCSTQDTFP